MRIHVDRFVSNNPDIDFDDVVYDIKAGVNSVGVVNVHFQTKGKYIKVDANGSTGGPNYEGKLIQLRPYLYKDGVELDDAEDEYYNHPDYWMAMLVVEMKGYYSELVTALKHEYFISYVPDRYVMDYKCLAPVELIVYED